MRERCPRKCRLAVNMACALPDADRAGGEVGHHRSLLGLVKKELEQCEFAIPRIAASGLGESAVLWGAISVALDAIPPLLLPQSMPVELWNTRRYSIRKRFLYQISEVRPRP